MRKLFFFIFSMVIFTIVNASGNDSISRCKKFKAKNKFGIILQMNMTSVTPNFKGPFEKADGFKYKSQPKLGVGLGFNYQYKIFKRFAIDVQAVLLRKSGQLTVSNDSFKNSYRFYNTDKYFNPTINARIGLEYSQRISSKIKLLIASSIEISIGNIYMHGKNQNDQTIPYPTGIYSKGSYFKSFCPRVGVETKISKGKNMSMYMGYTQLKNNSFDALRLNSYFQSSNYKRFIEFDIPLRISDLFFQIIYKF